MGNECPSTQEMDHSAVKKRDQPWLVWFRGLSAHLQTKGSQFRFPVRAHAWVTGQVPSRGRTRGNHILMFLSLPFSPPFPSLKNKINKIFFKKKNERGQKAVADTVRAERSSPWGSGGARTARALRGGSGTEGSRKSPCPSNKQEWGSESKPATSLHREVRKGGQSEGANAQSQECKPESQSGREARVTLALGGKQTQANRSFQETCQTV